MTDAGANRTDEARGTLVFHHNGIGDYVMSLPALRLLARAAPAPVHLICGDVPAAFMYDELPLDRSVVPVSPGRFGHRFDAHRIELERRYEYFVSLPTWDGPELRTLLRRSGARTTIGLFPWCCWRLERAPAHDMQRLFALAQPFAPTRRFDEFLGPLRFPPGTPRLRDAIVPPGDFALAVHAQTRPEKMWPIERYDRLLCAFLAEHSNWHVVALGFPAHSLPSAEATGRVKRVNGEALPAAMRLVAESDLFLGVDSCMLHVADLCRVPGVALFGPTRHEQFGYCLTPRAASRNLHAAQLATLTIEDVLEALTLVRGGSR